MMTAHDHMEFGTYVPCIIAHALSLSVCHQRPSLPNVCWGYGAEYRRPTPIRPHIRRVTAASKTESESIFRTRAKELWGAA
jgi:hypothetical protein